MQDDSTQNGPPQGGSLGKHLLLLFVSVLILYVAAFSWVQHLRERKGPWEVLFITDQEGRPSISVSQSFLNISDVTFVFEGEQVAATNLVETVTFAEPPFTVPFGEVLFFDTTFLPGTVTLDLFGHEIEFLPRVLVLNRKELPWTSGATYHLTQEDKVRSSETR